jgi:hypothetical protein
MAEAAADESAITSSKPVIHAIMMRAFFPPETFLSYIRVFACQGVSFDGWMWPEPSIDGMTAP